MNMPSCGNSNLMCFPTISHKIDSLDARGCPRSDDFLLDHAQAPSLVLATPTAPTHPSYGCVGGAAHTTAPRSGNGKLATCRLVIRDAQRRESDRPPQGDGRAVESNWISTLSTLFAVIHKEKKKQKEKGPADEGSLLLFNDNANGKENGPRNDYGPSTAFRLIPGLENAELLLVI
jgi:hypothetical protein